MPDVSGREPIDRADADAERARTEAAERERAARTREATKATLTTPVLFEFDRAEITDEGIRQLDAKVEALQANTGIRIRIEGNADDSGSDEYNMVLSQRRAAVVNRYFTERGIEQDRIQIVSYGEERPVCTSREESCRYKNLRDEFVILSGM